MQETLELIKRAQAGDEQAKTQLIEENMPLVKSIIKRYKNPRLEYDDLLQLGALGLIKAIMNFNPDFGVRFSTYAVPMIAGEVKRFIRDDGAIKVSRAVKTLAININAFIFEYKKLHDSDPAIEEVSKALSVSPEEVVFAMDSTRYPISLFDKPDSDGLSLIDRIKSEGNEDDIIENLMLHSVIRELEERDKQIIILRYFRDKTQSEIANELGISQVQVSRLENKILEKIKSLIS